MSNDIASLGLRIDTSDVKKAEEALDGLAAAGGASETAAGKVGTAWGKAAGKISGDTGKIVAQLQALNKTQSATAAVIAQVAASMDALSKGASKTGAAVDGLGSGAAKSASQLGSVSTAANELAVSEGKVAESAAQAMDRLTQMAKASLEASTYLKSLESSGAAASKSMDGVSKSGASLLALQKKLQAESDALAGNGGRAAKAAKESSVSVDEQSESLQKLLGKIDPVVAALGRLDDQEAELRRHQKSGLLDTETFTEYKGKIDAARNSLSGVEESIRRTGNTSRQTSSALRQLPSQFSDIFVSLQAGQSPLSVLLQQGSQIKDSFGGVGPALRETGRFALGLVNPYTLAAAAAVVLAIAYKQGSDEATAFSKALITTGNAAGTSAQQLGSMAARVSSSVGTIGNAAEVLTKLAASGKIASSSFEEIAISAIKMEKATGKAVDETIAEFVKLAGDPVKASKELNEQYNYLTAATYQQISVMKEHGDILGATALAESSYSDALTKRADEIKSNLGSIESAWQAVAGAAKGAWDAVLDIGREDTLEQKLDKLRDKLQTVSNAKVNPLILGDNPDMMALSAGSPGVRKEIEATLQAEVDRAKKSREEMFAASNEKSAIEAFQGLQEGLDKAKSKSEQLVDALKKIDQRVAISRKQGLLISDSNIAKLKAAAAEQFKEPKEKKAKVAKAPVFRDDAAEKMLQALREQESSLTAQLGVNEKLTEAERKRAEFERLIADLKNKDILTADQKSLLANQDAIKAQLDKNVAIADEVKLHSDSLRLQERSAQIQASIQTEQQRLAEQRQEELESFGRGGRTKERVTKDGETRRSYQKKQEQLDKATPASQLGSDAYKEETRKIEKQLDIQLAKNAEHYDKLSELQSDWKKGATKAFEEFSDQATNIAGATYDIVSNTLDTIATGVGDAFAAAIVQGKDLRETMSSLAQTILSEVISSLVQLGVRYGINAALSVAATNTVAAAQAPAAAATTAAWAPAATTASIGSFGAAAAIGIAAVLAALALSKGFRTGGYTGNVGTSDVAGVVHGQEYVFDAAATARIGVQNLEAMRKGQIVGQAPAVNYAVSMSSSNDSEIASGAFGGRRTSRNQSITQNNYYPTQPDNRTANQSAAALSRKQRMASRFS